MRDKLNQTVCVIDYGMGNLRSVVNKIDSMVTRVILSAKPEDILSADKLVLPGVGHFAQGMTNLKAQGILPALQEKVIAQGCPILGICLGMQLFTSYSEEGECDGLNWIEAKTVRFDPSKVSSPHFAVPHMGWNTLTDCDNHPLYQGLSIADELYFCHSYHVHCADEQHVVAKSHYGYGFTSSIERDNIHGMQFHPEKSHKQGAQLMANFLRLGLEVSS